MYQSELTDRVDEIEKLGQLWKKSGRQSFYNKVLRWSIFRDHPYITSAKGLSGWGQKNDKFLLTFSTIYAEVG